MLKPTPLLIYIFLIAACLIDHSANAEPGFDHKQLAETMYHKHIAPGYLRLKHATEKLDATLSFFCETREATRFSQVKEDFRSTVLAWSHVEHIHFGPVMSENRSERFNYWPDRKGRGQKQIEQALFQKDQAVLKADTLTRKSIALQGLSALEYLLYDQAFDKVWSNDLKEKAEFRCTYAISIGRNLKQIAAQIDQEWQPDTAHSKRLLTSDASQQKEVSQELFQSYITGLEQVRDMKIGLPLGDNKAQSNPKRAAFWRSGLSLDVIASNIEGLKEMFFDGGFARLSEPQAPKLTASIESITGNGFRLLEDIKEPIETIVSDPAKREKLKFLKSILSVMRNVSGEAILKATGLTIGFNAKDGD